MKDQEKRIIDLYNTYKSMTKVGQLLGVCRKRVVKPVLSKYGIFTTNYQNNPRFNIRFFDDIDTEEKAYWLGFLFADGYVSSENSSISLGLVLSDKNHLIKLQAALQCSNKVRTDTKNGRNRCRFQFGNVHTKKAVSNHGLVPNKSYILKFPTSIPSLLVRHFIRGYFEGDGHVGVYDYGSTRHRNALRVSCLGTQDILTNILRYSLIEARLFLPNKSRKGDPRIKAFQLTGNKAYNFLRYVYDDATIFLDRKYTKYQFAVQSLKGLDYNCGIKQGGCDIAGQYLQCKVCTRLLSLDNYYDNTDCRSGKYNKCKQCISYNNRGINNPLPNLNRRTGVKACSGAEHRS